MYKNLTVYMTGHNNDFDNDYIEHYKNKINLQVINVNDTVWPYLNTFSLNAFLCEFTTFYYVWKNNLYSQYVGFCHYRRTLPIDDIQKDLKQLNNGYIIFDRTSWYDGVFFPLIKNSTIYHIFIEYLKSYDNRMFEIYKQKHSEVPGRGLFITSFDNFTNMCSFMFNFLNIIIPEYNVKSFITFINNEISHNYGTENAQSYYTKFDYLDENIYRFWAFIFEYMCGLYIEYDSAINHKNIIEHLLIYGK